MVYTHFLEKFKNIIVNNSSSYALIKNNEKISWTDYYIKCSSFANALNNFNVNSNECVAIMGFNDPAWFISAVGSALFGVPFTGIYPTNGPEEVDHNLNITNSSVLVIENRKLLDGIKLNMSLKLILIYGEDVQESTYQNIPIFNFKKFLNVYRKKNFGFKKCEKNDTLCYIFTSGTTGLSKAVTITHENVSFTADRMTKLYQLKNERIVSYLPLSHIAASMIDIFCHFYHQGPVCFAKPDALKGSLKDTLLEVRPTMFFGVPRVWEKFYEAMMKVAEEKYKGTIGSIVKAIVQYIKNQTSNVHLKNQESISPGLIEKLVYKILGKKLSKTIKTNLGLDQCKYFMTGAAPISKDILQYFASIDIIINELYGMSETTGVITASLPNQYKWGSAGKPLIGTIKIADDGEILYSSKCVFNGYHQNQAATKETIEDGWLHTGDIGEMRDGYLYITGRKKELLITAGGENVAPVKIEERIKHFGPALSNIVVIGDKQKYLTCLITIGIKENSNELLNKTVDSNAITIQDALKSSLWKDYIQNAINNYNKNPISNAQKIQKFVLLEEELTIQNNCMTPTMKLKRAKIYKRFEKEIGSMY